MKLDPRTLADSQLDMLSRGYGATRHQSVTLRDGPWHIMQGRVSKTGDATKGTSTHAATEGQMGGAGQQ